MTRDSIIFDCAHQSERRAIARSLLQVSYRCGLSDAPALRLRPLGVIGSGLLAMTQLEG